MLNRLTKLSFIIGLFFTIVAVILLAGYYLSPLLSSVLNLYAGIVFLVFGLLMIIITLKNNDVH